MPRKVAFSVKKKKAQLQLKKAQKTGNTCEGPHGDYSAIVSNASSSYDVFNQDVHIINKQPSNITTHNKNRYNLTFKKEKNAEIQEKMTLSMQVTKVLSKEELEVSHEEIFAAGAKLGMPKRPTWDMGVSKNILETKEEKHFREYINDIGKEFADNLCYFDMNLENWRQLWRVLEFSDIVLLVTDIRYPVFHFSPALYDYVTKDLKKDMIVVFNKIDLVEAHIVVAWKSYFQKNFPKIHIMYFASYAGMRLKPGKRGRRIGNLHMAVQGSRHLMKLCETIVNGQVDLSSWKDKIDEEAMELHHFDEGNSAKDVDDDDDIDAIKNANIISDKNDTSYYNESRYRNGVLTIGFVGHPNVGKSSFLNAVMGKKVVSVSRTPGHTKHYQTIMLTSKVRLCDCPGLVFPSLLPKPLQVLVGCYPVAQVREPYSCVSFLCERVPVHQILRLQHPEREKPNEHCEWSAYDVCTAYAEKRGFCVARSARPDVYRAANNILRMVLDGRTICLKFYPPAFFSNYDEWCNHPEVEEVITVQAHRKAELDGNPDNFNPDEQSKSEDSDDNEEEKVVDNPPSVNANMFSLLSEDM